MAWPKKRALKVSKNYFLPGRSPTVHFLGVHASIRFPPPGHQRKRDSGLGDSTVDFGFAWLNGGGCVALITALREIRATYRIQLRWITRQIGHQIKLISPIQKRSDIIVTANRRPAFSSLMFIYVKNSRKRACALANKLPTSQPSQHQTHN